MEENEKGIMISTRTCTNPKPTSDGLSCKGDEEKEEECILHFCPGLFTTIHWNRSAKEIL